ncbi:MAG TPA: phosphoenolpyruvate carboxykinase (GTP), partial [Deltaproteobacteria bacterium]|nr:phosphoenolpyruvate carboxykinase (GTP) [Deltaproteobacteria bacterium]
TAPASQCPCISEDWESPRGVPISAFIFGGRRAKTAPLVFEAFDWEHGVYVGSAVASETTAAATGAVGVVRRDPMAMIPFCGYNMADYFAHWLSLGAKSDKLPAIFHVNWFRQDDGGRFIWPGFGENLRVLRWIRERCLGAAEAVKTAVGWVPAEGAIDIDGLDNVDEETMADLLHIDRESWQAEVEDQKAFYEKFGDRLPEKIWEQHRALAERLGL